MPSQSKNKNKPWGDARMKKFLFTLLVLLICSSTFFAYENADYLLRILNLEAATETVTFKNISENSDEFNSVTDLHYQQQKAVYNTNGTIENNRIIDYNLTIAFSGQKINITCQTEGNKVTYETGTDSGEITANEEIFILDNNIIWLWQLVYDYYKVEKPTVMTVFIPQLLVKNLTDTYTLEFEKTTELEGIRSIFFKLNNQSGMFKVNEDEQVIMMMMSGVVMERVE